MKEDFKKIANLVFNKFISDGVLKKSEMRYLINDRGIADSYFSLLLENKEMNKKLSSQDYYYMLCYMSFGAGAYFTEKQWRFSKPISDFTDSEIDSLFAALSKDDAVSLGFDSLGILIGSYNYNRTLNSIKSAFIEIYENFKADFNDEVGIRFIMQLFFNAGVSMVYEKFEKK